MVLCWSRSRTLPLSRKMIVEKIPPKFDPTFINRVFFPEKLEIDRLDLINYGECCDWSYLAYLCWKPAVRLWSCCCHAFVQANGKFYDSEVSTGVSKWQELRTCRELNCPEVILFMDVRHYMDDWAPDEQHWAKLRKKCWSQVYQ